MTLRLRLILAIVVLVTTGLGVFGVVTYELYAQRETARLDQLLQGMVPALTGELNQAAGLEPSEKGLPTTGSTGGERGGPGPLFVPPDAYAELRDPSGAAVQTIKLSTTTAAPELPADVTTRTREPFTDGTGDWRVVVAPADRPKGDTVIVAVPLSGVRSSLSNLVLIEAAAAAGLLVVLAAGSWLILRSGLRPLEHMATSARSISAGDLSERVEPADGRTEVGQLGLALNTMLDEIEEAFREREATELRLRQFLSDASHELRTPLTSIQGFAELYRIGADQEHVDLSVILRRIEDESARMKVLVEDLLLLARLDETRPVQREPVDLAVLAADACSDAVAVAPDRPVTLDAPQPVVVQGDRDHLRQAIANLVANAVRHTPDGTAVEVSAAIVDGAAELVVRDHGAGLDADALDHVFDRFWQADAARVGKGTGLGLAIVAGIAAEHGGTVSVVNAADGGAAFTIHLPLNATA